eukprot:gene9181-6458_t
MDAIIAALRAPGAKDTRDAATAQLESLQQEHPQLFLGYMWDHMSAAQLPPADRFFLCTILLAFVEDSWRSLEDLQLKTTTLQHFTQLALSEGTSGDHVELRTNLCRKLGTIVACMAKNGPKSNSNALPPHVEYVLSAYTEELHRLRTSAPLQAERLSHVLLLLHVFVKEMQTKRVGGLFEKVCRSAAAPLAGVMALAPFGAASSEPECLVALRALKCAYRIFGCGLFDAEFSNFILQESWKLAAHLVAGGPLLQQHSRLMDYAIKALQKVVVYFPTQLHLLTMEFFIPANSEVVGTPSDRSLLHFLHSVVMSGPGVALSEKAACRAMSILTLSLAAEEADAFVAQYLRQYACSPLLPGMMEAVIVRFLPDDCGDQAKQRWAEAPETGLEDLDMEYDNDASPVCCAEQLFLALTGSAPNADVCLPVTWGVVQRLLDTGSEADITAALHAIGIGYDTMRDGSGYLGFLTGTLLPLIWKAVGDDDPPTSDFVLRRVVWLIGMWCGSVPQLAQRAPVHTAFGALIRSHRSPVIGLTVLRAVENFVSDESFTLGELPPDVLQCVLASVGHILPQLQSPTALKQLVGLLYVLMERGALPTGGDDVMRLLLPVAEGLTAAGLHNGDNGAEDEEDGMHTALLTTLLECLATAADRSTGGDDIWVIQPLVVACTDTGSALTPFVEDEAWELLLAVSRSASRASPEALAWALQHTSRDFAALPTVFQCAATLLLYHDTPAESVLSEDHISTWLRLYTETTQLELTNAIQSVFLAAMKRSEGPLRILLGQRSLQVLADWDGDVQAAYQPLQLALVVSVALRDPACYESLVQQLRSLATPTSPGLVERVLLLVDVSAHQIYDVALRHVLRVLASATELHPQDVAAVQHVLASGALATQNGDVDGETAEERRANALLDVNASSDMRVTSRHFARLCDAFDPLLFVEAQDLFHPNSPSCSPPYIVMLLLQCIASSFLRFPYSHLIYYYYGP